MPGAAAPAASFAIPYTGVPTLGSECLRGVVTGSDMVGKIRFIPNVSTMYCTMGFSRPFSRPPVCTATQGATFAGPYVLTVGTSSATGTSFVLHKIPQINYDDSSPVDINYTCLESPVAPLPYQNMLKERASDFFKNQNNTNVEVQEESVEQPVRAIDPRLFNP